LNGWFAAGIEFLSNNSMAVWSASLLIVVNAAGFYWLWFRPAAIRLGRSLQALSDAIDGAHEGWNLVLERARTACKNDSAVRLAWQETESRVIALPHGQRVIHVMFGAPRDIWSANRLLSRRINVALVEAVPNLLVGIGLLFTFFFLTLALTQATAALLPQAGQTGADLARATRGLLSAAGAKFLTSLAGLLASIIWAIAARRRMARLNGLAESVIDRISGVVSSGGAEMAIFAQLQSAREMQAVGADHLQVAREMQLSRLDHLQLVKELLASSADQVQLSREVLSSNSEQLLVARKVQGAIAIETGALQDIDSKAQQQLDLTEELLSEARDQTGTFKRFETDLAVSLAAAITTAFSPQMQSMTDRLIAAIDGLSEKLGSMNQDALQRMLQDFSAMLKQTTESEMTHLRETLEMLAGRLTAAGTAIGEGAGNAAEKLDKGASDLLARVEQVSVSLATGATNLEGATQGVKIAMNDLDVTITQASELGKKGAMFVREALDDADAVFSRLHSASEGLGATANSLEKVSGQLADAVDSVDEMTKEQREVVNAVRDATPEAMASVQRVLDLLQEAVNVTATTMEKTKDSMAETSDTLGETVAEITAGISEYSEMVAKLHREMDKQLAKAVGSLDKGVVSLDESIEELTEVLRARMAGN